MINKQNTAAAFTSSAGTHQTGSPCPDDHNINIGCHHHLARTILKPKIPKLCPVHPPCRQPRQYAGKYRPVRYAIAKTMCWVMLLWTGLFISSNAVTAVFIPASPMICKNELRRIMPEPAPNIPRRGDRYGWFTANMQPADQLPANAKSQSNGCPERPNRNFA